MKNRRLFRSFVISVVLFPLLVSSIAASSSKAYSIHMGKLQTPNKLNLLIIVKASQNSNSLISNAIGAKTKLEIMQESILSVLDQNILPPNTNIGIMAFGHRFDRSNYSLSCSEENIEMILPFQLYSESIDATDFINIQGIGEAPTTLALKKASNFFPEPSPDTLNVILLVADGFDTCNSNPEDEAKILSENQQIIIYTISFLSGTNELEAIAQNSFGSSFNVPGFFNTNERASEELTFAIKNAFDDILAQVSTPVLPPYTPTGSFLPTSTATSISTDTATPTPMPTETPTQAISETTPTEELPSSPTEITGIFFSSAIFFVGLLTLGLILLRSRRSSTKNPQLGLDEFMQDLVRSYSSIGNGKYVSIALLKERLPIKYRKHFNDLLKLARKQHPNKIWIDKDSQGNTIVKIVS